MTASRRGLCAAATLFCTGIMLLLTDCSSEPVPPPIATAGQSCPQWVEFPADHHSNGDSPYLGCVSTANLRAMVANPADMESGRELGPANGERETRAIEAYQQGKTKPLQGNDSTSPLIVLPVPSSSGTQ